MSINLRKEEKMLKKNLTLIGLLMVTVFLIATPAFAQKVRG